VSSGGNEQKPAPTQFEKQSPAEKSQSSTLRLQKKEREQPKAKPAEAQAAVISRWSSWCGSRRAV